MTMSPNYTNPKDRIEKLKRSMLNHLLLIEDLVKHFMSEEIKHVLDIKSRVLKESIEVEVGVLVNENINITYNEVSNLIDKLICVNDILHKEKLKKN
jgi:hypothetical protein